MYKSTILFFITSIFFFSLSFSGQNATSDLDQFKNGGKIVSPAGTYRPGSFKPSGKFADLLGKIGPFLKKHKQLIVDIRGHSDDQGTDSINEKISAKRALYTEELILKHSGINRDRIIARGYSDHLPIRSNAGEDGRMVNRRVELILTLNRNSVGEITHIKNNVFTKPPEENDFKKAEIFEALFNLYKLNTRKRSGANIQLSDNSRLNIGQESLMVIYEMIESELANPDAWQDKKVKLLTGFLRTKLNNLRKGIKIETPQCSINSRSKIMLLNISEKKKSAISVFEGITDVKAEDETVNVGSGFGTYVEEGKKPSEPEPLPRAPEIISPEKGAVFTGKSNEQEKEITIKWNSEEVINHIQISEDQEFTKIVVDEKVSGNHFKSVLKGGDYAWRVAGINKNGIEGFPALSSFSVVIKKENLPLSTTPGSEDRPIDAHGATTIVKNNSITITGKTIPGAEVSVAYKKVPVDQNGQFSIKQSLGEGWNIIKISAVHPQYKTTDKWISICYFKKLYK